MTLELREQKATDQRAGRVFGYLQAAMDTDQVAVAEHERQCLGRFRQLQQRQTGLRFVSLIVDQPEEGVRTNFQFRPQGELLHRMLENGDVVLCPTVAGGFAGTRDLNDTLLHWRARNVTVEFLDLDVRMGPDDSEVPEALAAAMRSVDEVQRVVGIRVALRRKVESGRVPGRYATLGNVRKKVGGEILSVPSRRDRAIIRAIWMMRTAWGFTLRETVDRIEAILAKRERRKRVHFTNGPEWASWRVRRIIDRLRTLSPRQRAQFWSGAMQRLEPTP